MEPDQLLARLADTLRNEIAPAVDEEYPRTQAFMAAVVLERLSRQLAHGPEHAAAEAREVAELVRVIDPVLADAPPPVRAALAALGESGPIVELSVLIGALYEWGPDRPAVVDALDLIRPVLRRDIDRRMVIAR